MSFRIPELCLAVALLACSTTAREAEPAPAAGGADTALAGHAVGVALSLADVQDESLREALLAFELASGQDQDFDWQLAPIRSAPGARVYDLTFPSPRPSTFAENNTVWCRFYCANGLAEGERAPVALVLHHLGGDFGVEAALAAYLAGAGIHAIEVEFPYYGKRKPANADPRSEILREDVASWIEPMQQAVADIRRTVDWAVSRDDVDPRRIGVVGVSLGGIIGALASGVEPRLVRNVFVIAGGDLATIILTESNETKEMRKTLASRGIGVEDLRRALQPIEPLRFAHRIDRAGLMMINAADDQVIVRSCTLALASAVGAVEPIWLPGDHHGIAMQLPRILTEIRDHFRVPAAELVDPSAPPTRAVPGSEPQGDDDEFF